jgi:hypothetical protein
MEIPKKIRTGHVEVNYESNAQISTFWTEQVSFHVSAEESYSVMPPEMGDGQAVSPGRQ